MKRALTLLVFAAIGCRAVVGSLDECTTDAECGQGLQCVDSLCVSTGGHLDAGQPDAGTPDAGPSPDEVIAGHCATLSNDTEPYLTFAVLMPRSLADGGSDEQGTGLSRTLQLVFETLGPPARVGIRNYSIRVLLCDTRGSPALAEQIAAAVTARGALAVFTAGDDETMAAARATVPAGALLLSVASTRADFDGFADAGADGVPLVWRSSPGDEWLARAIAITMLDAGMVEPAAVLMPTGSAEAEALYRATARSLSALGASDPMPIRYDAGQDVMAAVLEANSPAYGAIISFASPTDAVAMMTIANELAARPWFFTEHASSRELPMAVRATRKQYVTGAYAEIRNGSADAQLWLQTKFRGRWGDESSAIKYARHALDGAMAVVLATHRASANGPPTSAGIALGLTALSRQAGPQFSTAPDLFTDAGLALDLGDIDLSGSSGPIDFDPLTGQAPFSVGLWTVTDAGFFPRGYVPPPPPSP